MQFNGNGLYHISEEPDIRIFKPRPSPSAFPGLNRDVVFAINEQLLHNYLSPRDCPRVTWYATDKTTDADSEKFMPVTNAKYVIAVEANWYERIQSTTLYCYEFDAAPFTLLNECAGYYVSYTEVTPVSVIKIDDIIKALLTRNVELRFAPSLIELADEISRSTLNFSLIRMRNASDNDLL